MGRKVFCSSMLRHCSALGRSFRLPDPFDSGCTDFAHALDRIVIPVASPDQDRPCRERHSRSSLGLYAALVDRRRAHDGWTHSSNRRGRLEAHGHDRRVDRANRSAGHSLQRVRGSCSDARCVTGVPEGWYKQRNTLRTLAGVVWLCLDIICSQIAAQISGSCHARPSAQGFHVLC